jgi:hypothetical protein
MTGSGGDDTWRRALLEAARASGASKAKAGQTPRGARTSPMGTQPGHSVDAAGSLFLLA